MIIDFKEYGGTVTDYEDGTWLVDGVIVERWVLPQSLRAGSRLQMRRDESPGKHRKFERCN